MSASSETCKQAASRRQVNKQYIEKKSQQPLNQQAPSKEATVIRWKFI
jgi:hypothetical protein